MKLESNEMKMVATIGGSILGGVSLYQGVSSLVSAVLSVYGGYFYLMTANLGQLYFWFTLQAIAVYLIRLGNPERFDAIVSNAKGNLAAKQAQAAAKRARQALAADERYCPHCAGVIKTRAHKCKHCHEPV